MLSKYLPGGTEESTTQSSSLDLREELVSVTALQRHCCVRLFGVVTDCLTGLQRFLTCFFFSVRRKTDHARIGILHLAPLVGRTATHKLKINIQLPQRISGIAEGDMRYVKPVLIGDCCILVYRLRTVIKNDEKR